MRFMKRNNIKWIVSMRRPEIVILATLLTASVTFTYVFGKENTFQNNNPILPQSCIPDKYSRIINQADSLQWTLIDSWTPIDSAINYLGNESVGEILQSKISTDSLLNKITKRVLLSPESFRNDSIIKESVFMPDFGILFIADTDSLLVSYSLYCDLCRFQNRDGYIDYNGENVRDELLILLKELFPKDKFVRNVTRRL